LEEDADMDEDLGVDFDHAERGDDSDSVDDNEIGEDEDEIDVEPDEDGTNQDTVQLSKDPKREAGKNDSNKRSFDMYSIHQVSGNEERKRRRP